MNHSLKAEAINSRKMKNMTPLAIHGSMECNNYPSHCNCIATICSMHEHTYLMHVYHSWIMYFIKYIFVVWLDIVK